MKNFIYLLIIGLSLISCGGGDDSPPAEEVNVAPGVPTLKVPADNKLCVDNTVAFQWNISTDANKDIITYRIEVAKDNTFSQIVKTADVQTNSTTVVLEKNTAYYWRIKATDSKGLSSSNSTTFKLYTMGDAVVNHLPFSPELVAPVLNTTLEGTSALLKWTAYDVDTQDALSYDVYFGTANPPTVKVGDNISTLSTTVAVEPTKQYYWRVVVKDNKGGETIGQVWKFKTN